MIKIAKYVLMLLIVFLFVAVVIGQSLFMGEINKILRSSGVASSIVMGGIEESSSSGDLLRELDKSNKPSKAEAKNEDDDYVNPALLYEGVDTSSLKNRSKSLISIEKRENPFGDVLKRKEEFDDEQNTGRRGREESKSGEKADYSGYYQLEIVMNDKRYITYAQIDEMEDSFLRISGNHSYSEFLYNAVPIDVGTKSGSWEITAYKGNYLASNMNIDITDNDGFCQLEGEATIAYNMLLIKGKKKATITGMKVAETKTEETRPSIMDTYNTKVSFLGPDNAFKKTSPLKSSSAAAIAGLAIAITGIAASRGKVNNVKTKNDEKRTINI